MSARLRGFLDELQKIAAEFSLVGLSPEAVMQAGAGAQPMETAGLSKALKILDRYTAITAGGVKTAAPVTPFNPEMPGFNRVTGSRRRKKEEPRPVAETKSFGGHVVGGAAAGRFVGEFAHGAKAPISNAARQALHGKKYIGTLVGAGLGLGEYGRKRVTEALQKRKEAMFSPATQLKNTSQIAKRTRKIVTGSPAAVGKTALTAVPGSRR